MGHESKAPGPRHRTAQRVLARLLAVVSAVAVLLALAPTSSSASSPDGPAIKAFPTGRPCWYADTWQAPRGVGADGKPRFHEGVDVIAATGTPLFAVDDGRITRLNSSTRGGIQLYLTRDDGTYYFYGHLSRYADGIAVGQRVTAGQLIGFVGQTGDAVQSVPHLHFEIHPGGGAAVNPFAAVKAVDGCGTPTPGRPPTDPLGTTPAGGSGFGGLSPLVPNRFADTREALGLTRFSAGTQNWLTVAGRGGVPADATAVTATVTVTNPAAAGFVTVYPCGSGAPETSTVNFVAGQTVANSAVVGLGTSGRLCFVSSAATDVLLDVTGFRGPSGRLGYQPATPTRLLDTRTTKGRLDPGEEIAVSVPGSGIQAATVNVTAVDAGGPGFFTVYPCGAGRPNASTLNMQAGSTVAAGTTVGLGGGRLCVYSSAAADVIVDLLGTWQTGAGLRPAAVNPDRILDTRDERVMIAGNTVRRIPIAGGGAVPTDARAVVVNLTAVGADGPGFVTAFPCGGAVPPTSTLNYAGPAPRANSAVIGLGGGALCALSNRSVHLIVDVTGYLR